MTGKSVRRWQRLKFFATFHLGAKWHWYTLASIPRLNNLVTKKVCFIKFCPGAIYWNERYFLATKDFTTYQWPPVMWKREWVKSLTLCFLNPDLFVQEKCWQDLRSVASFRLAKEFWFPTKYPQLHWQPAGHNFGPCYDKKEIHVLTLPSLQHHHTNHPLQIHQKTWS